MAENNIHTFVQYHTYNTYIQYIQYHTFLGKKLYSHQQEYFEHFAVQNVSV